MMFNTPFSIQLATESAIRLSLNPEGAIRIFILIKVEFDDEQNVSLHRIPY